MGREEENLNLTFKKCPPFCERLAYLKQSGNRTAYSFYHGTDISMTCFYGWLNGTQIPTVDNVVRLAELLDRRVDYILGREL